MVLSLDEYLDSAAKPLELEGAVNHLEDGNAGEVRRCDERQDVWFG
jgi:hypothetical protein